MAIIPPIAYIIFLSIFASIMTMMNYNNNQLMIKYKNINIHLHLGC